MSRRKRIPIGPRSLTGSHAPQGFRPGATTGSGTIDLEVANAEAAGFRQWLTRDNEQRCVLVEMDFVDEVDDAPVTTTVYLSDREFFDDVTNHDYVDVVRSAPQYSRMLSGEQLGSYVSSIGSLELDNADGSLDYLLDLAVDGSAIRFYYGGVDWLVADFKLIFVAVISRIGAPEFDRISVLLKDAGLLLDKSIGGEIIGGSGPNAERTSPMMMGYIHNLTPLLEDPATLKYRYTDYAPLTSVLAVRDKGVDLTGGYTDNGDRTFTLLATPDGLITCDVLAEEDGVGNTRVSDQMRAWVGNKGGLFDLGLWGGPGPTFTIGDEDDYQLGIVMPEPQNVLDLLARINLSGNCFWTVTHLGKFTFGRLRLHHIESFGLAETVIREDDIDEGSFSLEQATPQYYKLQGYKNRNWTKQTEFATSLTPEEQALYSRPGLFKVQPDGVDTTHASRPELYHKTLTVSPALDTLLSTATDDTADIEQWMTERRDEFLPWVQIVSITVGVEFYEIEIGYPVRLFNPRFGEDDGLLFQLIGMVIRLTDAKLDLRLARRNLIQSQSRPLAPGMGPSQAQVWDVAGSYSFVVPPDVYILRATILGAGAGGAQDLNANATGGRGGGSGEMAIQVWYFVTPGDIIDVEVRAGGLRAFYSNHTAPSGLTTATAGGNSSFGKYVALGGGHYRDGTLLPPFGAGVRGRLATNSTFPVFPDTFGAAEATHWFGGAGSGTSPSTGLPADGTPGGPAGGRAIGGAGGIASGVTSAGGGGAASLWGPGAPGGNSASNGADSTVPGTGGGGAGGTTAALGVGPFHDGGNGKDGYVAVFWNQPES